MAKNQLAAKEDAVGKALENYGCELARFLNDINAHGGHRLGIEPPLAQEFHVTMVGFLDVPFEVLDFGRPLEVAGVHHPDLDENKILENAWKHAEHAEQGMQAQAV